MNFVKIIVLLSDRFQRKLLLRKNLSKYNKKIIKT